MTDLATTTRQEPIDALALIARANLAESTKTKYTRVLAAYLSAGNGLGDAQALAAHADGLSNTGKAHLKAAVRLWAGQVALIAKSEATPENIGTVLATVARSEAITEAIKVRAAKGAKVHTWLSLPEVRALSNAIQNSIVGDRDRALVGLMLAAGLRRQEVVTLTFDDVKLQPVGDKMRTVLAVKGKGARDRVVPISDALARDLQTWGSHVGHTGKIARSLGMKREAGESMSAQGLFDLARKYGQMIGKPELAPHDLRRTYAQLAFEAGLAITQISVLLGHESIATTQRYLNLELDLETTASDFIPWG